MPKTVEEIRNDVLSYGFSPSRYSTFINHWIDEAVRIMFRQAGLRSKHNEYKFNLVSGTKEYDLPNDFGSSISLRDTNETEQATLERFTEIQEYDNATVTSGTPTHYIIDGNKIILYPTPDSVRTFSLRYNIIPSAIAEEASKSPNIAEQFYYMVEIYCLYKAFQKEGDVEMANHYKGIFDSEMIEFVGDVSTDTKDSPEQVEGAWPGGYP